MIKSHISLFQFFIHEGKVEAEIKMQESFSLVALLLADYYFD